MSYILDALQRADAERELGAVPTIRAQTVSLLPDGRPYAGSAVRAWRWAVAAVLCVAGLSGAWRWWGDGRTSPPPTAVVMQQTVAAPASQVPPEPQVRPQQQIPESSPPPAPVPIEPPPAPVKVTPNIKASRTADKPRAAPAKATANKPIPEVSELPEAIRRELPQINVGGAMYSADAASRMLIVNGQVLREGESISSDLVLEKINLKSAVLAYKGQRYKINY